MVDIPLSVYGAAELGVRSSSPSGASGSPRHSRRHTIPDVAMELSQLSKKARRHLQRALSPQQGVEDGTGTPKGSKKQKKVQRGKERDDKTGFLQASSRAPVMPEISRTASVGSDITRGREYMDFVGHRDVTASLNPSMTEHRARGRERLRRTNSEHHIIFGGQLRCPPERKQFYRQFIKSIKFYGINSTATNRLETPAPSRYHSENLAMANPSGYKIEKLWLELQAYLLDRTEEWLFFNQSKVDRVLSKIVHYSCTVVDCTQSLGSLRVQARDGYEPLHGSYSTPTFSQVRKTNTVHAKGDLLEVDLGGLGMVAKEAGSEGSDIRATEGRTTNGDGTAEVCVTNGAPPCNPPVTARSGLQWCASREGRTEGSDPEVSESNKCTVEHQSFLSALQQRALGEVDNLLCELDEAEGFFTNRRQMGDNHPTYRTKFFKRRVCALNLYHKVTHGLAENLCQLSNWLGVAALLPDICLDSPVASLGACTQAEPSSNTPRAPLSPSAANRLRIANSSSSMAHDASSTPQSPLTASIRPHFLVGSPDDSDTVTGSFSDAPPDVSVQSLSALGQGLANLHRVKSQESRQDPYREFVSRALKRKGITFMVTVS